MCGTRWNEWVPETRLLKQNAENEALRMRLRQQNLQRSTSASSLTMPQILDQQLYLEEEASEKLSEGWGEEDVCTYPEGYVMQPVFACKECSQRAGKPFGFCFGCSLKCHVEHTVYELFDKRHFRCDCGTPRSGCSCTLSKATGERKEEEDNHENMYNHNFDGLYCWCDQPYDHNSDAVMLQCVRCMDWFHPECIERKNGGSAMPSLNSFSDFICADCTEECPFLALYATLRVRDEEGNEKNENGEKVKREEEEAAEKTEEKEKEKRAGEKRKRELEGESQIGEQSESQEKKAKTSVEHTSQDQTTDCKWSPEEKEKIGTGEVLRKNTFWRSGWRKSLCRCHQCQEMLRRCRADFLLTEDESSREEPEEEQEEQEEQEGTTTTTTSERISLLRSSQEAFARTLNPTQQLNLLAGYQAMVSGLKDFLRPFAERGEEVTQRDIETFFARLKETQQQH
ncbi:E3 ubiquitin-protein ligase UBR7, variant 2 [Balamuthia mandrillaris]